VKAPSLLKVSWRNLTYAVILPIAAFSLLYPFLTPDIDTQLSLPVPDTSIGVTPIPDFSSYNQVKAKKKAFFDYLRPVVEQQNEHILQERHLLLGVMDKLALDQVLTIEQELALKQLTNKYKIKSSLPLERRLQVLITRVDIVPVELVLVQGANESAWGTSRFARQGYNFFGLWCYRPGCGFVPSRRIEGGKHEVARFSDLAQGVAAYLLNLNTHNAYKGMRHIRSTLRKRHQPINASRLAEGLMSYSERGQAYIDELQAMIRINQKYMK